MGGHSGGGSLPSYPTQDYINSSGKNGIKYNSLDNNDLEALRNNPLAQQHIQSNDPNTWNQLVTYNAFKDQLGRAPTQEEMNKYADYGTNTRGVVTGLGDAQSINALGSQQSLDTLGLGQYQNQQSQDFINSDTASRAQARQQLSDALIKQGQATFQQGLPATEETLNAQHLLNGSGLGQEIGRQQGNLATNIANQVGVVGAGDIATSSAERQAAQQNLLANQQQALGLQNTASGNALSRQLSVQDFYNQAKVAKEIGATSAPSLPSSKTSGTSGALAGAGTGASAGLAAGPYGPAIGALVGAGGGYYAGSQQGRGK